VSLASATVNSQEEKYQAQFAQFLKKKQQSVRC